MGCEAALPHSGSASRSFSLAAKDCSDEDDRPAEGLGDAVAHKDAGAQRASADMRYERLTTRLRLRGCNGKELKVSWHARTRRLEAEDRSTDCAIPWSRLMDRGPRAWDREGEGFPTLPYC